MENRANVRNGDLFSEELTMFYASNLESSKFNDIISIKDDYSKIFQSYKNNIYDETRFLVLETNISKLNSHFIKFINIFRLPIVAYIEYKKNNYELAIKLSSEAIINARELYDHTSFDILKLYEIQQNHNICRVLFKQENYNEWGYKLYNSLINALNVNQNNKNNFNYIYYSLLDQLIEEIIIRDYYKSFLLKHKISEDIKDTNSYANLINKYILILFQHYQNKKLNDKNLNTSSEIFKSKLINNKNKLFLLKNIAKDLNDADFKRFLNLSKKIG